jgi:excisionase family DNA binding protein
MLTVNELSAAVGVSLKTTRSWLARRPDLGVRVGNRRLVPRWAVREYLRSQATNRAKPLDAVPGFIARAIQNNTRKAGEHVLWIGPLGHDGLPRVVLTQSYPVGRYAYVQQHGPLAEGEKVTSTCGDPRCLEHLGKK